MFYVDLELDKVISAALDKHASDIHFDSQSDGLHIRFRIDGCLQTVNILKKEVEEQVVNRIKVLCGLDISEKRLPQDGRWDWNSCELSISMRISTLPTIHGETVVCRIMNSNNCFSSLEELGMDQNLLQEVDKLIHRPNGLFLISGPTGSGKTSTLYALLRRLNQSSVKLICLEDPVEATIDQAVQVQINDKIGLSFSVGLRSILRQDPDIIMVGEIRDEDTASLAVKAALTGHLVFATIHTNSAVGIIERLLDMGVEEYLVKATLIGGLAQRLVRKYSKEKDSYEGRLAIFELLSIPQDKKDEWHTPECYIVQTLKESAQKLLKLGLTKKEEVERIGIRCM